MNSEYCASTCKELTDKRGFFKISFGRIFGYAKNRMTKEYSRVIRKLKKVFACKYGKTPHRHPPESTRVYQRLPDDKRGEELFKELCQIKCVAFYFYCLRNKKIT
ncbi:MAG: hypothetical protein LBK61_11830 [Spirochaetaceae bacterium]|jgi:hypothetical protein|nr:hypothetical protein [Spirochaetaceae bacterium]